MLNTRLKVTSRLTLTGSLLQELALCELRGSLRAKLGKKQSGISSYVSEARRIARLVSGRCSLKYCIEKRVFEGEVFGYPFISSPDAVLLERGTGRVVGVIRARIRHNLNARELDYIRLLLDAYGAMASGDASAPLYMIVVVALDSEHLFVALKSLPDRFRGLPYLGDSYSVNIRVYREEEALPLLRRAVQVLGGIVQPRANPGPACSFCPFQEECPYVSSH